MRLLAFLVVASLASCSLDERGGASASGGASGAGVIDASPIDDGNFAGVGGTKDAPSDAVVADAKPDAPIGVDGGKDASVGADCANYPGSSAFVVDGDKHCYWKSSVAGSFADAVASCSAPGTYLVTIHSAEENEFVRGFTGADSLWLGISDKKNGDDSSCDIQAFGWLTKEPVTYANWTDNNPDCVCGNCDGNCDCQHRGAMLPDGGWRDRWEGDLNRWICEVGPLVK